MFPHVLLCACSCRFDLNQPNVYPADDSGRAVIQNAELLPASPSLFSFVDQGMGPGRKMLLNRIW
jgi:hypothetical protein